MKVHILLAFWLVFLATSGLFAQRTTPDEYIAAWKGLAVSEMQRSGIPASITLAQGLLESSNGNSRLAVAANNHFGIKCHGWEGEEMFHDDDKKGECFRKYKNARESFVDHTDFLVTRSRYAFLFDYKSTDYKNWAKGLQKAGYATDPKYPQKLIDLIERYQLNQYDTGVTVARANTSPRRAAAATASQATAGAWDHVASFHIEKYPVKENNRTNYISAREGDTYASLGNETDVTPWQLSRYNEAKATDPLHEGQIVYLQPKRRKAEKGREQHTVRGGETMYAISQNYAVRLAQLYRFNRMEAGSQPQAGDVLNLRKKKKK